MTSHQMTILGLIALLIAPASRAEKKDIDFDTIQTTCVQAGAVSAAAVSRAVSCQVTKGRWFSTIEHDDFYQAQYCLQASPNAKTCGQRALLLFVNRAYTPTARLTLERIDPAGTEYDDPQVYATAYGYVMTLTARSTQGAAQTGYYQWKNDIWQLIDTSSWHVTAAGF